MRARVRRLSKGVLVPGLLCILYLAAPAFGATFPQDNPPYVSAGSVQEAQRALAGLGRLQTGDYSQGAIDDRTAAAIRDFQSSHNLPVSGVLDPDTMAMLTSHAGPRALAQARRDGTTARVAYPSGATGSTSGKDQGVGTSVSAPARGSRRMPGTAGPIPLVAGLGGLLAAAGFALWRAHRA